MGNPYSPLDPAARSALFARLRDQAGAEAIAGPMLSTQEAAAVIGLSPVSLAHARSQGRPIVCHVRVGRLVKYRVADLIAYLDAARVPACTDANRRQTA